MDRARHELMQRVGRITLLAAIVASSACRSSDARAHGAAPVDTLYTSAESLRRFRADLSPVTELSPAFSSAEDVARAFIAALAANDAERLARTLMTRAEFAWLYYPGSLIAKPPYELPVGIAWFELEGNSLAGVRRLLATYGGRRIAFQTLSCSDPPVAHGTSRVWNGCVITIRLENGSEERRRMFGGIYEHHETFKLVTAANDL